VDTYKAEVAERAIELGQKLGLTLRMVEMPEGVKDADELIGQGVELWKQAIAEAKRLMRPLVEHEEWAAPMEAGFDSLSAGLDAVHGDAVLRWWRDGVIDTAEG